MSKYVWCFATAKDSRQYLLSTSVILCKTSIVVYNFNHLTLQSMGMAEISCEGGCNCTTLKVNALHAKKESQLWMIPLPASHAAECIIRLTTLQVSIIRTGDWDNLGMPLIRMCLFLFHAMMQHMLLWCMRDKSVRLRTYSSSLL